MQLDLLFRLKMTCCCRSHCDRFLFKFPKEDENQISVVPQLQVFPLTSMIMEHVSFIFGFQLHYLWIIQN